MNRGKYALCSAIPGVFMAIITFWAGYLQVATIYIPKEQYLLATLAVTAMILMLIVFIGAFRKWYELLKITTTKTDFYGEQVKELVER
jgi:carbon starvation protein